MRTTQIHGCSLSCQIAGCSRVVVSRSVKFSNNFEFFQVVFPSRYKIRNSTTPDLQRPWILTNISPGNAKHIEKDKITPHLTKLPWVETMYIRGRTAGLERKGPQEWSIQEGLAEN